LVEDGDRAQVLGQVRVVGRGDQQQPQRLTGIGQQQGGGVGLELGDRG